MAATVFCGTPQNSKNITITHLTRWDAESDAKKSLDTFKG